MVCRLIERMLLLNAVAGVLLAQAPARSDPPAQRRHSYVIVQGAWNGSWAYRQLDSLIRLDGDDVYRPSLTGLGERVHLASATVNVTTHITDVVNAILFEDLHDVILVGHSYGGMVITGVADQIPGRIARLVYVDAFVPNDGESIMAATRGTKLETFENQMVASATNGLVPPSWVTRDTPPRDVAQPVLTFTEPIHWSNPAAPGLRADYILTVEAGHVESDDDFFPFARRARSRHWPVHLLTSDHDPERSAPQALATLLLRVTSR